MEKAEVSGTQQPYEEEYVIIEESEEPLEQQQTEQTGKETEVKPPSPLKRKSLSPLSQPSKKKLKVAEYQSRKTTKTEKSQKKVESQPSTQLTSNAINGTQHPTAEECYVEHHFAD